MTFPPLLENVPGLLCEGTHILAGRPKAGKSQLVLQLATAIATGKSALGHFKTNRSHVLYLALEDGARRLQRRLESLAVAGVVWPDNGLIFHTSVSLEWDDRLRALHKQLKPIEDEVPLVVVIDTWAKFRPPKFRGDPYQADYGPMSQLTELAQHRPHLTTLVVHHTRKPRERGDDEATALVSGTHGLTGAADGMMLLDRKTGEQDGVLTITGRDVAERTYTLRASKDGGAWTFQGEGDIRAKGDEIAIIEAITAIGGLAGPSAVAARLGEEVSAVKKRMERMHKVHKLAKPRHGQYAPPE